MHWNVCICGRLWPIGTYGYLNIDLVRFDTSETLELGSFICCTCLQVGARSFANYCLLQRTSSFLHNFVFSLHFSISPGQWKKFAVTFYVKSEWSEESSEELSNDKQMLRAGFCSHRSDLTRLSATGLGRACCSSLDPFSDEELKTSRRPSHPPGHIAVVWPWSESSLSIPCWSQVLTLQDSCQVTSWCVVISRSSCHISRATFLPFPPLSS